MTNQITMNFWVKSVVWVALGCDQHLDSVLYLLKSVDPSGGIPMEVSWGHGGNNPATLW